MQIKYATATLEVKAADDAGHIEGIASAFHVVDSDDDVIHPGAFAKSIQARGDRALPMLWQHDARDPVGFWSQMGEDDSSLRMSGQLLVEDIAKAREARALARAGVLSLSVGFMIDRAEPRKDSNKGGLDIFEADLWETSLVTFAANPAAAITAVKGAIPTVREFEKMLTLGAGLSRTQARTVIRDGYRALATQDAGNDDEDREVIEALKGAIAQYRSA